MAEYKVDTSQLRAYSNQIENLQRQMNEVAAKMTGLQIGSVLQIKASTALIGKITDCKWAAINQASNLGKLARGLDDVAGLYERNENNLKEPKTQAQADAQNGENGAAGVSESIWDKITTVDDYIRDQISIPEVVKWLGSKSIPFSLISMCTGFASGDAKGITNGLKQLMYTIGNGTKAVCASGGWDTKLINFLGLKASGASDLTSSYQKWLSDMNFSKQTTAAGKVATVCKWAGYALTFVSEGIDNYNEFDGDWTNSRFWGETLIEGATSVGLSIGAGILVSAALPATWPAIAVGAASAGVVWLGNKVVEHFTGQDIGEWVSDLVYGDGKVAEVKEWVGERMEDVGEAVQDFGEDLAEGVENAWNSACDWVGGLFG